MLTYKTKGTCSRQILFNVENNVLTEIKFVGGCTGNLGGISNLVLNQDINFIIEKLKGIKCKNDTSCPDQLANALLEYKAEHLK